MEFDRWLELGAAEQEETKKSSLPPGFASYSEQVTKWPKCRRCNGRGKVTHFILIDEDDYFDEEEPCEFCEATGHVDPAHLAEYEASLPQPINGEDLEEDIPY